ncbi:MAG: hypothetical protein ACI4VX_02520, partial [Succinivibrionaceae bacterium]
GEERVADWGVETAIVSERIKLSAITFNSLLKKMSYSEVINSNLKLIYQQIEVNQIFGSKYIMKILNCSERTARNFMNMLKDMGILVAVVGKGKGNYRFKYDDEL